MSLQIQLNKLLNNLPDFFNIDTGGNVYNFFLSIANELYLTEEDIGDITDQININTATGDSLDAHAIAFGLYRNAGESDTSFRARILASFIRPQITKPRLISAVEDLSTVTPIIEEYFIDKWWLGGNPVLEAVTESLSASGNQIVTSQSIMTSGYPDIFPFYDTQQTGTNYGSGATINDNIITTSLNLPITGADFLYQVTYTPKVEALTPTSAYDFIPESFLYHNTILHNDNTHNNTGVRWIGESTESGTTIAPSADIYTQDAFGITTITGLASAGYGVDIDYWDEDNNHIYRWRSYIDRNGILRFNDSKRIDSEIGSERRYTDTVAGTSVDTAFDAANVIGIYDGDDSGQTGTNFFIELVTETVVSIGKDYIETTYDINSIESIYLENDLNENTNYWEEYEEKGNFFIDNKIYLAKPLLYSNTNVIVSYYRKGSIINGNTLVLPQATTTNREVIVKYRKNPIENYTSIPFDELLYVGHSDPKFTFEVQIEQDIIKWGNGYKWGEGYIWGQFGNPNAQTIGEVIDSAKAAGTKAYVVVRNQEEIYSDFYSYYDEALYEESYY